MKILRGVLLIFIPLLVVSALAMLFVVRQTNRFAEPFEYNSVAAVPLKPVAIVFGALVYPDHSLSPILEDRVQAAVYLYKAGKVKKLLMTGDNSRKHYNEPQAMANYAMANGVPARDIALDYAGFDTYDSCYRAREIFGIKSAVLVTQRYHVHRAIMIARHLGIDAVGVELPDWSKYPNFRFSLTSREWLADLKATWDINVTHRKPHFLGPKLPIAV